MGSGWGYNIPFVTFKMNYKESKTILAEIKKSKNILINCHRSPDPDSVGSALSLKRVLEKMDKNVEVVCPDPIGSDSEFLQHSNEVRQIDYDTFDFSEHDLFMILDSSEWTQVTGHGKKPVEGIKRIVVDHHYTNAGFGDINLLDGDRSSTCEVLFRVYQDWKIKIDSEIAEDLLSGLVYDTSSLMHSSADSETAKTFATLMEMGADKNKIILNIFRNISFENIKLMGEILKNMEKDDESGFVWSAVPYETFSKYGTTTGVKSMAATLYASSVRDTNYGMVMVEERKNNLSISLRAKDGYDISKVAEVLGGGGHKQAGAVLMRDINFDSAVVKALEAARKYVRKS